MRNHSPLWLTALGLILALGVWRLFELRFAHGDVYPPYSSLRADPYGSRALFDSIAGLPGFQVVRNFRPLEKIPRGPRTVFYLGTSPNNFEFQPDETFDQLEKLAAGGARVVIGFRSAPAERVPHRGVVKLIETPVQKRWRIRFTYGTPVDPADPSQTALAFQPMDPNWHGSSSFLERRFGSGSLLLVARSYPLSNEGLQKERATGFIAHLLLPACSRPTATAPNCDPALTQKRAVLFDESHLGVVESGSIAGLAHNYHLEGVLFALLALAALYLWKSSVSFLPPFDSEPRELLTSAKDASSGLANLLRRNIPGSELIGTCVAQWEHDRSAGRYSPSKIARVRAIASRGGDPAASYAEITRVLGPERTKA